MCLSDKGRQDYEEIVNCLQLCFGFQETTQTLSCQFYNRVQRDGESLGDFSRALLRIYSKMEKAAMTEDEAKAFSQLKDKTLCEQFVNGAQETWMRRELRRIHLEHEKDGFAVVRAEALRLFQEANSSRPRPRVREMEANVARSSIQQSSSSKDSPNLLQEMVEQQKSILVELGQLRSEVTMLKQRRFQRRRAPPYITCFDCGQKGHYRRDCPQSNSSGIPQQTAAPDIQQSASGFPYATSANTHAPPGFQYPSSGVWHTGTSHSSSGIPYPTSGNQQAEN